jgi:hypothetical protein
VIYRDPLCRISGSVIMRDTDDGAGSFGQLTRTDAPGMAVGLPGLQATTVRIRSVARSSAFDDLNNRGVRVGADKHDVGGGPLPVPSEPSPEAETVAVSFGPADAAAAAARVAGGGDSGDGDSGGAAAGGDAGRRRRIVIVSGAAVLAVAVGAGVLAVSGGGSHAAASGSSRQGSQIGNGGAPSGADLAGGSAGQSTSEQGGGGAASGSATAPSSLGSAGGQNSAGGAPTSSPGQPGGSSNPSKAGRPSSSAPSSGAGPSAVGTQPSAPPSQQAAKAPAYVGRLASSAAQASSRSTSVTLQTSGSSSGGDTLLVSVMLTNTGAGGVSASDSAGNSYSVVADQSDGAGDRTLILAAVGAKALGSGGSVTLKFPLTSEHHVALDDFSGVAGIGGHSSATAASGPFASGSASGSASGIVFGVAGVQGGESAAWSSGFTALPTLVVSPADQLATAYESAGSGSFQASGSCDHQWMAAVATLTG